MTLTTITAIAYGLLAFVGGIIGYKQVGSKASLISGSISGLLLCLSGILQLNGVAGGLWLGAIVTAALVIVFGVRLAKTRKLMPAGLMLSTGAIALFVMLRWA
jgi:uncharacterized membrane protein (UPF0136 family)